MFLGLFIEQRYNKFFILTKKILSESDRIFISVEFGIHPVRDRPLCLEVVNHYENFVWSLVPTLSETDPSVRGIKSQPLRKLF
jgi:hypothetical protein